MALNETISTGNKYRRLKDASTKLWQRLSFWTKASDVEFDNGATAEASLGNIQGITDSLNSNSSTVAASAAAVNTLNSKLTSFQTGVDTLYNQYVSKGVTPSGKTLAAITSATDSLYNTAYANGKSNADDILNKTRSGSVSSLVIWDGWTAYGGVQSANHGTLTFSVSVSGNIVSINIRNSEYNINHSINITIS